MRRFLRITWLVLLAAGAFAGCGGDDTENPDATSDADIVAEGAADGDADTDVPTDVSTEADAEVEAEAEAGADADEDATADEGGAESVVGNPPICEGGTGSGTRRRWVDPVSGFEYCEAACRGCTAECRSDGTADEGWYAACTGTTDAGCGALPGLIARANCM